MILDVFSEWVPVVDALWIRDAVNDTGVTG